MKWMIRVDMEGVTGVVSMDQVTPGAADYSVGRSMMMHDLLAVLDGLLQEESDEVYLYDIHFFGRNVELNKLDPRVRAICGKPHYAPGNRAFLDESFDGMILLGLHAKSGEAGALLAHNYEHDILSIRVNGLTVGEIGLEAMMAGEAGVPLVMVTADSAGAREAETQFPGVVAATVKESLGSASALCYPTSVTGPLLKASAAQCRERAGTLRPFVVPGPVELELRFREGPLLKQLQERLEPYRTGNDTFLITGESVVAAWETYLIAKS